MKNRYIMLATILGAFAHLERIQAVIPAPDGCYPNFTTAEGCNALGSLTTGAGNTGIGWFSLFSDTTANFNTGVGAGALALSNADNNTAVGAGALFLTTTGGDNTAVGANALVHNDSGADNNAFGTNALFSNVDGYFNNAHGRNALVNSTGSENNAFGDLAMEDNTTGASNTAIGDDALRFNVDGSGNIAIGDEAGTGLGTDVNNCIAIGAPGDGPFAVFDNTCFIGNIFDQPVSDVGTQEAVYVDQYNVVGISASSCRFKHDIQPMDKASEAVLALKPVTFKYKADANGRTQYGLIAEEVATVNPDLVVQHKDGEISTVRYEQVNAMLLNEFLKEHKKVEDQQASISQLKSEMQTMLAQLKEQAAQIQRVSTELQITRDVSRLTANNR